MRKKVSKILKIALYVVLIVLALSAVLSALVNVPVVQQMILQRGVKSMEKVLETKVEVGHIQWSFPNRFVLDDVNIWDQQADSLIHIKRLETTILKLDRKNGELVLGELLINEPHVNFYSNGKPNELNYRFLTQLGQPQTTGPPMHIKVKKIILDNGTFDYDLRAYEAPTDRKFNERHLRFENINSEILAMSILGDSLDFKVKKMSTTEQSGLQLNHLACKAKIHWNGMEFSEMLFRTPNSSIEHYLAFDYDGYPALSEFIDSVQVRAELESTSISFKDLALFSNDLKPHVKNTFDLQGSASGLVSNFKVKGLKLNNDQNSMLAADLRMKGLPNISSTYVDLDIDDATTLATDVEDLLRRELPDEIHAFGAMRFQGYVTGFLNDFAIDGSARSALGLLTANIHLQRDDQNMLQFDGKIDGASFDLGKVLGTDEIGLSDFKIALDNASGSSRSDLQGEITTVVDRIQVRGAEVTGIDAEGHFTSGSFEGSATCNDQKAKFTFNGTMDFTETLSKYKFTSTIHRFDLFAFNLDSVKSIASGNVDVNLVGNNLDQINGMLSGTDLRLLRQGESYGINNLFASSGYKNDERSIILRTDFADVDLKGNFLFSELNRVYADFLETLFPDYYEVENPMKKAVVITADAKIRQNALLDLLMPYSVQLGNGSFRGEYQSAEKSLSIDGRMDEIARDGYVLEDYFLNIRKKPHQLLNMTTDVRSVLQNDSSIAHSVVLNASILPNDVDFLLNASDTSDALALRSYGLLHLGEDTIDLRLEQSHLYSYGRRWDIKDNNHFFFTQGQSVIEMLELSSQGETAYLTGRIGSEKNQKVSIWLNQFQLANINPVLASQDVNVHGYANGTIDVHQVLNRPLLKANFRVQDLVFNGDTLGNFKIISTSDEHPLVMDIDASIEEGMFKNLRTYGRVDWRTQKNNFDLDLVLNQGSVKPFENIFTGLASDFRGVVNARMKLKGSFDDPDLSGFMDLKDVAFNVDYLNTDFILNDRVSISETAIDLSKVRIKDPEGHTARAKGKIQHDLFDDFVLDLSVVDAESILAMNTTAEDNDLFYGKAYGSGDIEFKGPLDDIYLKINAESNKGTKLFIPVYPDNENALVDYVSFVDQSKKVIKRATRDIQGITMDMIFKVNEDAEFELLFDELLDDKIYGRGFGSVKIEMNTYGDFFMFGDFEVTEGYYPFSSPMLVSERFTLQKGSKIRWDGDPYNAYIDMEASIRRNKAKPYHLMLGSGFISDQSKYQGEIPVDVLLFLRGELFNPEISFGIDLPESASISGGSEFLSILNRVRKDEDELNRQVFSLVTFGSFSPTNFYNYQSEGFNANNISQTVNNNLSSFLSGQINNWLSQYNQNWEFGFDWQPENAEQNAELILSVRRKLFNDRLEIAGSVDAYTNNGRNPYNLNLVYNVKEDGKVRVKAFQKLANDPTLGAINNITTTGVGFFFRTQFDRIRFRRKDPDVSQN